MKRSLVATLVLALGLLLAPLAAFASPIKTFIKDFTVSAPAPDNLKSTLKTLLASRLRGDGIEIVETEAEAEVVVFPSYTQLGKMFSLDAVAKSAPGRQVATAYEQGDNPDTVIASLGKLAGKLKEEITKGYTVAAAPAPVQAAPVQTAPVQAAPAPVPAVPASAPAVSVPTPAVSAPAPVVSAPARTTPAPPAALLAEPAPAIPAAVITSQGPHAVWSSPRLAGAQSAVALAGPDQFLTVQGQAILLYRKDAKFTVVAQIEVSSRLKVVGLDTIPAPEGGVLAFVSAIDDGEASSSVYQVSADRFKLLANKVPYLFRSVALFGGPKQLFAQQITSGAQYYGDVFQASFVNGEVKLGKAVKLPSYANIFNFNMFRDKAGNSYTVAFTESGYLAVFSDAGNELWRSEDKFGGSENFIMGHDPEYERFYSNGDKPRFLDQRILVTEGGDLIVPQNSGFMVVGNMRSYTKYSLAGLTWNGSALEESWKTRQGQGYLADYLLDPASRHLVVLEVTQKEGVFGKGASALRGIPLQ
ncbi:hypothetical protein [Geomonas sp.]|uniref:hypothetical protein n=1 Tax=Geomonas sp. TaxID=2651584 RepID=UPI002B492092|nr:hypothetical protein [Geomonas sp.]HJV34376.1 hypothetical protein [Geomonas sp.]